MQKKVFISRAQTAKSIFYEKLTAAGIDVHGESLIEITPVLFDSIPEVDWIFFYSKNGVRYFFEQASLSSPSPKLGTIGPRTADFLEEHFGHPTFVGNGNPTTTAPAFLKKAKGQRVLFPRAKNSMRSVQQFLENEIEVIDLIVYDNTPKKGFSLTGFDVLVFTSPMNAKAYFTKKKKEERQKVIAIGETTAAALRELGLEKIIIAETPSEESLTETVLSAGADHKSNRS